MNFQSSSLFDRFQAAVSFPFFWSNFINQFSCVTDITTQDMKREVSHDRVLLNNQDARRNLGEFLPPTPDVLDSLGASDR